jgi:hypothetical protein
MKIRQYLIETDIDDLIGRNRIRRQIYTRLKDKNEYIKTIKAEKEYYEKIIKAYKSISSRKYNLSTVEGWKKYLTDLKSALDKAVPNVFTAKHINSLQNDKASVSGYGNFNFSTEMDKWDYLTAIAMKQNKMINPDDHKIWLKK